MYAQVTHTHHELPQPRVIQARAQHLGNQILLALAALVGARQDGRDADLPAGKKGGWEQQGCQQHSP